MTGALPSNPPTSLTSREFAENKFRYYGWMRETAPVFKGKVYYREAYFLSRYDDCRELLTSETFVRNRSLVKGGRNPLPFPLPGSLKVYLQNMSFADNAEHTRLRTLVSKGFTSRAVASLESAVEKEAARLLDGMAGDVNFLESFARPLPGHAIAQVMGLADEELPGFSHRTRVLTEGMSGWGLMRGLLVDLPRTTAFIRHLVAEKRRAPGNDILSGLVAAEAEGETLSEDELIAMIFLLVSAGYKSTVYLLANAVVGLIMHPLQMEKLRADPSLVDSAVEEVLRFLSPIHAANAMYATCDVVIQNQRIPRGSMVMPILAAANRDPRVFVKPEIFDVTRTPNRHLAFGGGAHTCLGLWLARLEMRIALRKLIECYSEISLACDESELELQHTPFFHRYKAVPLRLNR